MQMLVELIQFLTQLMEFLVQLLQFFDAKVAIFDAKVAIFDAKVAIFDANIFSRMTISTSRRKSIWCQPHQTFFSASLTLRTQNIFAFVNDMKLFLYVTDIPNKIS
jgi:hypothetical protein